MPVHATLALLGAILLLVLLEFRDSQFAGSWRSGRARLYRNLCYLLATVLVMPLLPVINREIRQVIPSFFDWPAAGALEIVACFLTAELLGWLQHYVKHRNQFLWSFHFQHHRDEQFNVWLTTHTHAIEVILSAVIIAIVLRLLGFSTLATNAYLIFYSFIKVYQHSARRYRLGPLDYVIIGPAYHRIHHQVSSRCNYGVSLTVFDILFRTARWPENSAAALKQSYGTDGELPFGYWREMVFFLGRRRSAKVSAIRDASKELSL